MMSGLTDSKKTYVLPMYCNFLLSFTITMSLLSAGHGKVLQISTTSIGILHNAPFSFGD